MVAGNQAMEVKNLRVLVLADAVLITLVLHFLQIVVRRYRVGLVAIDVLVQLILLPNHGLDPIEVLLLDVKSPSVDGDLRSLVVWVLYHDLEMAVWADLDELEHLNLAHVVGSVRPEVVKDLLKTLLVMLGHHSRNFILASDLQIDNEVGASIYFALDLERSSNLLDELLTDRQAEVGAPSGILDADIMRKSVVLV